MIIASIFFWVETIGQIGWRFAFDELTFLDVLDLVESLTASFRPKVKRALSLIDLKRRNSKRIRIMVTEADEK